jgi:hypothetical protein
MKVYLAGPMTNCNEKQRREWRSRIKQNLKGKGYDVMDPTRSDARKGSLAVSADIEEADVVIANLWRESIGTVLGIVHARRCGIPVILIDQHYIDSPLLNSIVEHVVRDEDAAVNKLHHEVGLALAREVVVIKRNGAEVKFDIRKLQRSIKAAVVQVGIDDPITHILIAKRVYRAVLGREHPERITASEIKATIFREAKKFCLEDHGLGERVSLLSLLDTLEEEWETHENLVKGPARQHSEAEMRLLGEIEALNEQLLEIECERDNLREQLSAVPDRHIYTQGSPSTETVAAEINKLFRGRHGLCISMKGRSTFRRAFERAGIEGGKFDDLFVEKALEGRQSNLNTALESYLDSYPCVLYAFHGLRHLSKPEVKHDSRLITGHDASTVTRQFITRIRPKP